MGCNIYLPPSTPSYSAVHLVDKLGRCVLFLILTVPLVQGDVIRVDLCTGNEGQQVIYVCVPEHGTEATSVRNTCSEFAASWTLIHRQSAAGICPSDSP